jgi:hypothetical protein
MLSRARGVFCAVLIVPALAYADDPKPEDAAPAPAAPPAERPAPADKAKEPPPPAPVAPFTGFDWQPFGYLRMQYIAVQDDPNVAFVGRDDGFEIQNARIGARGRLGTRASFVISFDGAVDERTQVNSPQGKLAVGLRDAYADVAVAGLTFLRAGYFTCWLDPEAQIPDTAREFVDNPIETRGMRPTEGYYTPGLPPGRSIGAALRMDPAVPSDGAAFGFEIASQNGADEFSSNNDNDMVALSVAGIVRFPHDGFLVFAGRWNPRTVGDLPLRMNETDFQGSVGTHINAGPLSIGGAFIVQHTTFDTSNTPATNAYGGHAQVMIRIPAEYPLAIGYRFGVIDPNDHLTFDQVMEHTVGAVLGMPSLRMRLQLQATHVQEQAARDLTNDRIQLGMEVVL